MRNDEDKNGKFPLHSSTPRSFAISPELFEGGFEVFDDLLCEKVRIGKIFLSVKSFQRLERFELLNSLNRRLLDGAMRRILHAFIAEPEHVVADFGLISFSLPVKLRVNRLVPLALPAGHLLASPAPSLRRRLWVPGSAAATRLSASRRAMQL
jgi:hypothetical protein